MTGAGPPITGVRVAAYKFPTPSPESDGTLRWNATVAVTVTLEAGGQSGLGWTYSSASAAAVIHDTLAPAVHDLDAFDPPHGWSVMHRACRNLGTKGLVMQAISAVDIAWWDLKARLLDTSLSHLFGRNRDTVPIYGSGGFCTLTDAELADQVRWWRSVGCPAMKIKIGESWGTRPARDLERVRRLRQLAGDDVELMVDANGAYTAGHARRIGAALDELGVTWFEEPVSSDDVAGLAAVRAALRCDVTAGEYTADVYEVERLLPVVDCLQLDATRAADTPDGSVVPLSRRPAISTCPHIARRRCTPPWLPRSPTSGTWSGLPITPDSNHCSSTDYPTLATVRYISTSIGQGTECAWHIAPMTSARPVDLSIRAAGRLSARTDFEALRMASRRTRRTTSSRRHSRTRVCRRNALRRSRIRPTRHTTAARSPGPVGPRAKAEQPRRRRTQGAKAARLPRSTSEANRRDDRSAGNT